MKKSAQFQHNTGIREGFAGFPFLYRTVCDAEPFGQACLGHPLFLPAGCNKLSDFHLIHIGRLLSEFTITRRKQNEQEPAVDLTETSWFPGTQLMVERSYFMVQFPKASNSIYIRFVFLQVSFW